MTLTDYRAFVANKAQLSTASGFPCDPSEVNPILKPFQRDMVAWAVRGGRRALFASFGMGKTLMQLEIERLILEKMRASTQDVLRGLIVLPLGVRQEFMRDAGMLGLSVRFIRQVEEADADGIYLTNYETVRDGKLDPREFTVLSLDEAGCFAPGTLVETPKGLVPIEAVRIGDEILNASGVDRVQDAFRTEVRRAVRVSIGDGSILSSDNHPYFTARGWVAAAELRPGDAIVETTEAVRLLREGHCSSHLPRGKEAVLQSVLLSEMSRGDTRGKGECAQGGGCRQEPGRSTPHQPPRAVAPAASVPLVWSHHNPQLPARSAEEALRQALLVRVAHAPAGDSGQGAQPRGLGQARRVEAGVLGVGITQSRGSTRAYAPDGEGEPLARDPSEDGRDTPPTWGTSALAGWQGPRHDEASARLACGVGGTVGIRVPHLSEATPAGPAELSVRGFGVTRALVGGRSGWEQPSRGNLARTRREEDRVLGFARVDRVEVLESGHPDLARYRDADGKLYFYDLTAASHPSYSVAGLLVHNCLRGFGGTKTFRELMKMFEGIASFRFVATATPSPNEFIELLAYAAFLDIMDVGQAKTRWFKRDSTHADRLTLHEHKQREFWLWCASWALFVQAPSDLCACGCHALERGA